MSDQANEREELNEFEAELASLVPNRGRSDPRWRALLAKEASLTAKLARCPYCGAGVPPASDVRTRRLRLGRWAWPAAFSAMTAVAAALLVVVLVRPATQVVQSPTPPAASLGQEDGMEPEPAHPQAKPRVAEKELAPPRWRGYRHAVSAPYPQLLDQVLERGLDGWKSPAPEPLADTEVARAPLSSRELLEDLLGSPVRDAPLPRRPGAKPVSPSGA